MLKKIVLLCLISLLVLTLPGCYDYSELDERAWVIALGLDKGKENKLAVTAVIPIPKNIAGGGGGEGASGGGGENFITVTLELPSALSILEELNAVIDRRVDLSHTEWIVFSKELAQEGMEQYINSIARFGQVRHSSFIVVCEGRAEDLLAHGKPNLEDNVGKYYELLQRGWRSSGFIPFDSFHQFYAKSKSLGVKPVALLAAPERDRSTNAKNTPKTMENYRAGQMPLRGSGPLELMGGAVFKQGRMVGVLDSGDVTVQKILSATLQNTILNVPDPHHPGYFIIVNAKQKQRPRIKVQIVDGVPQIELAIKLEGDVLGIQSMENYTATQRVHVINQATSDLLLTIVQEAIAKSQQMGADFLGFGLHAKKLFFTWEQWENYQWDDKYALANITVQVDYQVRRTGLIHEMMPYR